MEWNNIVNDFKNGSTVSALSRKYQVSYAKINSYLIKNKIKEVNHCKLSKDKEERIIQLIKEGKSIKEISKQENTVCSTINLIATENNLTVKKAPVPRKAFNKDFDDNYFSVIDTETKAYFLGLLYTDGNVRVRDGNRYFVSIELQYQDKYILEKLASELKSQSKLYERKRKTNYSTGESHTVSFESCNSKQLFDDLGKFGIIPNKTYEAKSFKNAIELIPKHLLRHFLRGLIDGDGTISRRESPHHHIAFVAHYEEACKEFDKVLKYCILETKPDLRADIRRRESDEHFMYNLRYRRIEDVKAVCTFLYKDATVYLTRKYEYASRYFDGSYDYSSLLLCENL